MKLKTITIQNFRCYKEPITIEMGDIVMLIGKNDIGKSTILEALEIFFNNEIVKISQVDVNVSSQNNTVIITCDFYDLPTTLTLDSGAQTNLAEEYLTIAPDTLRIRKEFDCGKSKPTEDVFIVAKHPTTAGYDSLLGFKEKDLQKMVGDCHLDVPLKGNPQMRKAIWASCADLNIQEVPISVTKGKEDAGRIWDSLVHYLPIYALFQSDRSSTDADGEVQNPMKIAIQTALSEATEDINAIKSKVRARAMEIATETHEVMKTLDSTLASTLTPSFTDATLSKWTSLFSVSMNTTDDIPLNKRGSGIRRLILLSFFKAQTERKAMEEQNSDVIYAIEEPETSLHPNFQKMIINSFYELSQSEHCQVLLTTHSPNLAQELPIDSIRFISRDVMGSPTISMGDSIMSKVVDTLGVFHNINQNVKVMVCVEGPTDVIALKSFSKCLHSKYPDIINLEDDERVVIIPLGGSSLKHWVQENYLRKIGCPEVHIYDNDVSKYKESIDAINRRDDKSWGTLTKKYEIENYLHPDAIKDAYGVEVDTTQQGVPALFGKKLAEKMGWPRCTDNTAKNKLSRVFEQYMTIERIEEIDQKGEVKGWLEKISKMLE